MNSLPKRLGGEPLKASYGAEDEFGAESVAVYGDVASLSVTEEYITRDTESGKPELFTAPDLLAAGFGLVYGCAKKSYQGTIKPLPGGLGPASSKKKSSKPLWFSCRIDGAEGDEDFKGHAVGWTSKKAAWLVIAANEKLARSVVSGLPVQ